MTQRFEVKPEFREVEILSRNGKYNRTLIEDGFRVFDNVRNENSMTFFLSEDTATKVAEKLNNVRPQTVLKLKKENKNA